MLPAVDLGGRVWLGSKSCKGGPAAPAFGGCVVNLITAKAMELTIPESFLLRANEVIE
jgi:hypothetical protein